jgi:hypothetical protein
MNEQFEPLSNDEVLFVTEGRVLMPNPTFKVGEFLDALAQAVSNTEDEWSDDNEGWFSDGLECEALRFEKGGWQRGRVRLRLEFCAERRPKMLDFSRETPGRENLGRENLNPSASYDSGYGASDYSEDSSSDTGYRPNRSVGSRDNIYADPDPNY